MRASYQQNRSLVALALNVAFFACGTSDKPISANDASLADISIDGSLSMDGATKITADSTQISVSITANDNDAMWKSCGDPTNELLHYSDTNHRVYIGTDVERECSGFRFALPIAKGALIESATLTLRVMYRSAAAVDRISIQTWNSDNVPPFSTSHTGLTPADHAGGFATPIISSWLPFTQSTLNAPAFVDFDITTPDLKQLLQSTIDRAGWTSGNAFGLFLRSDSQTTGWWVGFKDSTEPGGPWTKLTITYRTNP